MRVFYATAVVALVAATAAFAVDPPPTFNVSGQLDDVGTTVPAENDFSPWRVTAARAGHVNLRNVAGTEVGTAAAPIRIDPTNTTQQTVTQGTAAAVAGGWPVKLTDGTSTTAVKAASTAPLATDPAAVVVVSPNGNQATAAAQATQLTALQLIDNPVGSAAPGTAGTSSYLHGCVYTAAGVALTDGQQAACQLTSQGAIKTDAAITSTVGSYVDKGAFTYGTDKFNPTGGIFQDTSPTLTAGQVGVSRMTSQRALHVNLRDSAGAEFATTSNPLVISPSNAYGSFVFGDVTTAALTQAKVERTAYIEQTANAQRSIASASASDAAAGTGARQVKIYYCTAAMACGLTETVTLNGVSFVNTVSTTIAFVEKMEVVSIGSTGSNVGILTLKAATAGGGVTIGTIAATDNQTFWAHHYVDAAKTCNITGFSNSHSGTTVGSGGVFVLKERNPLVTTDPDLQISDFNRLYGQDSANPRNYGSPIKVVGPSRIMVFVTPETSSSTVYRGALDFYEQ